MIKVNSLKTSNLAEPDPGDSPTLKIVERMQSVETYRDLRLDFCRGLALIIIFIDHIPGNSFGDWTLRNFGFCDAAEVFVLISGVATYLAYGSKLERQGSVAMFSAIGRRWIRVYLAHLLLLGSLVAIAMIAVPRLNVDFRHFLRFERFYESPVEALTAAATLRYLPTYLDILPLYLLLLGAAPLPLLLIRRSVYLALAVSVGVYCAARYTSLNLSAGHDGLGWVFNPFTWQLLYVIGMSIGYWSRHGDPTPRPRVALMLTLVFAIFSLVAAAPWRGPDLGFGFLSPPIYLWPAEKTFLSPLRVLNVLSLWYLFVNFVPSRAQFLTGRVATPLLWCGQHSLVVYSVGVLLSCIGYIAILVTAGPIAVQIAVTIGGTAILIGLAFVLDRINSKNGRHSIVAPGSIAKLTAAVLVIALLPGRVFAFTGESRCNVPASLLREDSPLKSTQTAIRAGMPFTIVALGSSSTEGVGASRPENTYPAVLQRLLASRVKQPIRVVNLGVGGEVIAQTSARIERQVLPFRPTLVVWQVGTNDFFRGANLNSFEDTLARGVEAMRKRGIDVILMDLQLSPKEKDRAKLATYLTAIDSIGDRYNVPVIHRYNIMRYWVQSGELSVDDLLVKDRLHMSDTGYRCLAEVLTDFTLQAGRDEPLHKVIVH
jgi:lysophospholipase L1-like esterase